MKKPTKKDNPLLVVFAVIVLTVLIGVLIRSVNLITNLLQPPKTLYITSNHFPINIVPDIFSNNNIEYVFYGTPQPNGTECVNSVAIEVNPFNYTSQSFSSTTQTTFIYNPEKVADIYYNSQIIAMFNIPNGYTLLCPNIVNATRWP